MCGCIHGCTLSGLSVVCGCIHGCTLSGLSVVCGCIHGCTLSGLRDALVAKAECIECCVDSRVCALSVQCQVERPYPLPYTKTVRYSYLTFA